MRFLFVPIVALAVLMCAATHTMAQQNPPAKTGAMAPVEAWRSLSKPQRFEILAAWKALPETTRPAFPLFRNSQLEKMLAPAQTATKIK